MFLFVGGALALQIVRSPDLVMPELPALAKTETTQSVCLA